MVQWRTLVAGAMMAGSLVMESTLAMAGENAEQWVQKMLSAARQTSYQGHSVMLSGGQITSMAIYHAPFDNEVWERVVHLSGEPAEILRKGSTITCLHPDSTSRIDLQSTPMGK
ncbi:MAG TPA: sigma-E factor regulatory protein RseB domain-containing protein, partial [Dongiaceae bacterium]|nr:sigma-E factor regulatory protein RseB domain-containing protein [Dongiaceae bacterium]